MAKKMYTPDFIVKAILKHGEKYDYSETVYLGNAKLVNIRCKIHGIFHQLANDHLSKGAGCPSCAGVKRLTIEEFVLRANKVHNNSYIYDAVIYKNTDTKVLIRCKNGHEFLQTPHDHLQGAGCPHCAGLSPVTEKQFLEKAVKIHGSKYDYRLIKYSSYTKHKIEIVCSYHNKSFWQTPQSHCEGRGCPICGGVEFMTVAEVTNRFKIIHGDKYDYSKVIYTGKATPILITCKIHGDFWQKPMHHWNGSGCSDCAESGFDSSSTAVVYIISINDDYCGYGISNNFNRRFVDHKINFKKHNATYKLIATFECIGKEAQRIERLLKQTFPITNTGIAGFKTEATTIENLPKLLDFISDNLDRSTTI